MTSISVVIATLGRSDALRDTLESVMRCDPLPHEVLVVDGAEDGSAAEVVAPYVSASIPVRHVTAPRGLTRQRNHGTKEAAGDVIVFFDDDVDVAPHVFEILGRAYEDPSVLAATGRVIEPDGGRLVGKESKLRKLLFGGGREGGFTRFGYPRRVLEDEEQDIAFMQGCFMTVRKEVAEELRFDENLPGYGLAEDEDFSYRVSRRGRIRFLPQAVVHHKNLGFGTRDARRFGRQVVVNRTYLFRKNFERTFLARLQFSLFIATLFVHRLINREWAGIRGLYEGVVEAWRARK